jgi:hypothetical protein
MGLTSSTIVVLTALLAVGMPLVALYVWRRVPGPPVLQAVERLSLFALAQGFAVLLAFLAINDQYLFFTSWQDLLGAPPGPGLITATGGLHLVGPSGAVTVYRGKSQRTADGGQLITESVLGARSGITDQVLVHLPPGYSTTHRSYPVVELLQGWHSPPQSWVHSLKVLDAMATQERSGALGPVIAVMPNINVARNRDLECTDVPRGPQAETWLTTDIRDLVLSQFRALPSARSWGLMGYSTGGYCAAKFVLHQPQWYGSAVVMGGYFEAVQDSTTGNLWGGSQALRDLNSPLWLVTHRPPPAIDLLAFTSRYDKESYPSTMRFLAAARAPMQTFSLVAPRGGHNLKALSVALPEILVWLGGHLQE